MSRRFPRSAGQPCYALWCTGRLAFQLVVVTPVSLAAGFTSVASNVTIGVADLLTALIGIRLLEARSIGTTAPARIAPSVTSH